MKTLLIILLTLIASHLGMAKTPEANPNTQRGKASFYAGRWIGKKTASGEIYRAGDFTAAHRTLPFGTRVKVTNLKNGKSVEVRINNRGPFVKGRIIDVSLQAANAIQMKQSGVVPVEITVIPKLVANR